jgi:hypothetical protein
MSRRQQIEMREALTNVAREAAQRERARILWILDRLVSQAQKGLERKLMAPAEEQLAKWRFELTRTIVTSARVLIMSGARPNTPSPSGQPTKEATMSWTLLVSGATKQVRLRGESLWDADGNFLGEAVFAEEDVPTEWRNFSELPHPARMSLIPLWN